MDVSSLELVVAVLAEILLLVLLVRTASFRSFPAFSVYVCWGLLSDIGFCIARSVCSAESYFHIYLAQLVLDSALMFAVLVELTWSLLRPIRQTLPRYAWLGIAGLVAVAGLLLWPVAGWTFPARLTSFGVIFFRLQQDFALLRVVIFIGIAACSQAMNLSWRNREMQLATGLGAYSLVSLAVTILHTHQLVGAQYHWLDVAGSLSYLLVLFYWVACFASKEATRQEFTPQMAQFLLAAAGATRANRAAMEKRVGREPGPQD